MDDVSVTKTNNNLSIDLNEFPIKDISLENDC